MIYGILIFLIIGAKIYTSYFPKEKKPYCWVMWLAFTLVIGLRGKTIGTDTPGYVRGFLNASDFSPETIAKYLSKKEFLYYILQSFIRSITDNYSAFLLLIAAFYMMAVMIFIFKHSTDPVMSLLIFMPMGYFSFSMAGLRQTIAMGFLILGVVKLLDHKYIFSLILVLISVGFHITSLIYFLIFLIYFIPLNAWYISAMGVLSAGALIFGKPIVTYMVDYVWGDDRSVKNSETGGIKTFILLILVFIFCLMVFPEIFKKSKEHSRLNENDNVQIINNRFFSKCLLLAIPFQSLAIINGNAFRLSMPFHFFMIALLPNALNRFKEEKSRLIGKCVLAALLIYLFFSSAYYSSDISPYVFAWQD